MDDNLLSNRETVLKNCFSWNRNAHKRAEADVLNPELRVPNHFGRYAIFEGKPKWVKGTQDTYRAARMKDAERHNRNCVSLMEQLSCL